jgi:hypothetical protein
MRRLFPATCALLAVLGLAGLAGRDAGAIGPIGAQQAGTPAYYPIILRDWLATPTSGGPTPTPTITRSPFQFTLQAGSPAYIANIDNALGCKWFGISGQVFDLRMRGVIGLFVHVEAGGPSFDALTGSAPRYGASGWVIQLGEAPIATTDTYRVQLRDGAGQPLSATLVIPTFADCYKNQILVNFVQNH